MVKLKTILLLLTLFVLPTHGAYRSWCSDDWACAGADKSPSGEVNYWVENKKPYPITITLKVRAGNLQSITDQSRDSWEVTTVLPGREKREVLQLEIIRRNRPARDSYEFDWIPGDMNAQHDSDHRYHLPFAKTGDYRVVQGFNGRFSHSGASRYALDFAMPVGTPVHAARGGVVIDLEESHWRGGASRRYAKYANFVVVLHSDGTTGEYYHLKRHGVVVSVGDRVSVGQLLGYSGNTGFSSLPHLHFAVYKAQSHGRYESVPVQFSRSPNTYERRGLGMAE